MVQILFATFLVAFLVQFVFWSLFAWTILRHKNRSTENQSADEGVSIIVCANNEIDNLKLLLPNLYKQEYSRYEIIIVNDRSNDGTFDFLKEESTNNKLLKIVTIERTPFHIDSKKYAIFLGLKAAQFEKLLFTDADCQPVSSNWLSEMSSGFNENTEFVLGISQFIKEPGVLNGFARFETQMTAMLYSMFAILGNPYMAVGRNLAYRKSTFLKNKGFNGFQRITGGDDDLLVNKIARGSNTKIILGRESLTLSKSKKTLSAYIRQKVRHISVSKLYRNKDKFLLGMYSATHILFWLSFVILAGLKYFPELVFGAFLGRIILNCLIIHSTSKKFGDRIDIWLVPILDIAYAFYLLIIGTVTLGTKKVKWT